MSKHPKNLMITSFNVPFDKNLWFRCFKTCNKRTVANPKEDFSKCLGITNIYKKKKVYIIIFV